MAQGPAGLRASASCRKTRSVAGTCLFFTDRTASLMPTTEPQGSVPTPAHPSFSFSTEKSRRNSRSFLRKNQEGLEQQCGTNVSLPSVPQFWPPRWRLHTRPCTSGSSRDSWAGKPLVSRSAPSVTTERASQEGNLRNLSLFLSDRLAWVFQSTPQSTWHSYLLWLMK